MKTKFQSLLATLLLALAATNASADLVKYIYDGSILASLDGVFIYHDPFTLTLTVDSANISYSPYGPSQPTWTVYSTPVVSASFTDPNLPSVVTITDPLTAYVTNYNSGWVFQVESSSYGLVSFFGTGSVYNLKDSISLSDVGAGVWDGATFSTSAGTLVINQLDSGDSFTAAPAEAVPEPSTFALLGLTGLGFALYRRRK